MQIKSMRAALAAALVAAGATLMPAWAADPIKIGVIYPIHTVNGKKGVEGAQLAAKMINEKGGLLGGRQVEIVAYDTNYSPVDGVAAVQRLIGQDGIRLVAGELTSTVALSIVPVVQAENALYVATVPKHPDITSAANTNVVRLNSTTKMDSEYFNDLLKKRVGDGKLALLLENSDYGRLVAENLKSLFGAQLVFTDFFGPQQSDFNAVLTNMRSTAPSVVCVSSSAAEQSANILRGMQDLGFRPTATCFMPGLLNSDVVALAGDAAEGVFSAEIYASTIDNEVNKGFVKRFETDHGRVPEKMEELSFEGVSIIGEAIAKAGTAEDVAKLVSTIRSGTWSTPRGEISFSEIGQAEGPDFVSLEVRDGKIVESKNAE